MMVVWRLSPAGGVPVVVRGLLRHFDRDEFEFHVCTVRPLDAHDTVHELGDGIEYYPLGLSGPQTKCLQARAVVGVRRVASRVDPDILHVHSGTASYSILATLALPLASKVIEVHDAPQSARMSYASRMIELLMARGFKFCPLVHSSAVREGAAEAWDLAPSTIKLVPLGVDLSALGPDPVRRAQARRELAVPLDAKLVSYVARLVPEKRPRLFLEVARRVTSARSDVFFALVGGGTDLEAVRELNREMGLAKHVRITGFVDDLPGIYCASDLFLSTSRYEGFGLAIVEAMASGVPVVSTLVGGVEDAVGSAGILEPSSDPDRLAAHVISLLDDPDRRGELSTAGLERARSHLDVRRSVRGFEDLYRELTD